MIVKYKYFIGIDVSKSKLDICILNGKKVLIEECIANTVSGINHFFKKMTKLNTSNTLICCEHTGIYTHSILDWAYQNNFSIWLEKAIQIKRSIGFQRGKNDKIDAYRIGLYAFRYQDQATIFQRPTKEIQEIKHLLGVRSRLLKARKQLMVPLKELKGCIGDQMYQRVLKSSKKSIQSIEDDIKKLDKNIQKTISKSNNLAKKVDCATSVEGVGIITAITLIVATNEFKHVKSSKELACYVGVVPFAHTSGSSIRGRNRVSYFAHKPLKSLLHLCSIVAIQKPGEIKDYYDRKVKEGKPKMNVINAIRNKLIKRIYACVTQNKKYEKNYTPIFG